MTIKNVPIDVLNEARRLIAKAELTQGPLSLSKHADIVFKAIPEVRRPPLLNPWISPAARRIVEAIDLDYRDADLKARSLIVACGFNILNRHAGALTNTERDGLCLLLHAEQYLAARAAKTLPPKRRYVRVWFIESHPTDSLHQLGKKPATGPNFCNPVEDFGTLTPHLSRVPVGTELAAVWKYGELDAEPEDPDKWWLWIPAATKHNAIIAVTEEANTAGVMDDMNDNEPAEYRLRVEEMTEAEYNALPEFEGF